MKSVPMLTALVAVLALASCTHNAHRSSEAKAYTDAQAKAMENVKPIVEFEGIDGQPITLSGVKAFRVYGNTNTTIRPLPQQQSPIWSVVQNVVGKAATAYGWKLGSETLQHVFDSVATNAGDHSVTTITDSFNDQSDHSTHGDTITGSSVIGGDVSGPGAGIGNEYSSADQDNDIDVAGDGSAVGDENRFVDVPGSGNAVGDGNEVINNSGRQESPGDFGDGGDCEGGAGAGTGAGGDCDAGNGGG
jgi:hypothetical protein